MNALLICPSPRPAVQHLAASAPLAAVPLLGQSLVEYWLTHLAGSGARHVRILAADRIEQIQAVVAKGTRWGIEAEVTAESRELTPAKARLKFADTRQGGFADSIVTLDHFPGLPDLPLFDGYDGLFRALMDWMPSANTVDRVGIRNTQPGVWIGTHSRVSPLAELRAPCWIGQCAYIGPQAVLGPNAVLEDRAFVEANTEVVNSVIGPDTFVGRLGAIRDSLAWGSTLINWKSGVSTEVTDAFLLCALRRPAAGPQRERFLDRLVELCARNKEDLQGLWKEFLINRQG